MAVAALAVLDRAALDAAVACVVDDLASTRLDATTALLGACTPSAPSANLAVKRACLSVAGALLVQVRASVAARQSVGDDSALAVLDAAAA